MALPTLKRELDRTNLFRPLKILLIAILVLLFVYFIFDSSLLKITLSEQSMKEISLTRFAKNIKQV